MRLVAELPNKQESRLFSDYLTQMGISNQIIEESTDNFEVWVHNEKQVQRAEELYQVFHTSPEQLNFQSISRQAQRLKREEYLNEKDRPPMIDVRSTVFFHGPSPRGVLTMLLIFACIVVAVFSRLGDDFNSLRPLLFTKYLGSEWLPLEIRQGEVWRLITPIFIHFGFLHLLFNLYWLRDLASMVEDRKGSLFLGFFVMAIAITSNYAQYIISGPSLFGGMSGVLYGLLGYIWMKGKFDPASRLSLHKSTVTFMIFWYVICFTGVVGNIANAAHTAGLLLGIIWGYLTSFTLRQLGGKIKKYFEGQPPEQPPDTPEEDEPDN